MGTISVNDNRLRNHPNELNQSAGENAFAYSADGKLVVTATGADDEITLYSNDDGTYELSIESPSGEKQTFQINEDTLDNGLIIDGRGGDDNITVGPGVDIANIELKGGRGSDRIVNHADGAVIRGEGDADRITNFGATVDIFGGSGGDTVEQYGDDGRILGESGGDRITTFAEAQGNIVDAGSGHDDLTNLGSNNQFAGGGDVNSFTAGSGATGSFADSVDFSNLDVRDILYWLMQMTNEGGAEMAADLAKQVTDSFEDWQDAIGGIDGDDPETTANASSKQAEFDNLMSTFNRLLDKMTNLQDMMNGAISKMEQSTDQLIQSIGR